MRYYTTLIAGILGILMLAVVAQGADKTVAWDAVAGVSGYRISISTDNGVTWTQVADVPAGTTEAVITVSDTGMTLIRASSYNNIGEAVGTTTGVWFNPSWEISAVPTSLRTPGE